MFPTDPPPSFEPTAAEREVSNRVEKAKRFINAILETNATNSTSTAISTDFPQHASTPQLTPEQKKDCAKSLDKVVEAIKGEDTNTNAALYHLGTNIWYEKSVFNRFVTENRMSWVHTRVLAMTYRFLSLFFQSYVLAKQALSTSIKDDFDQQRTQCIDDKNAIFELRHTIVNKYKENFLPDELSAIIPHFLEQYDIINRANKGEAQALNWHALGTSKNPADQKNMLVALLTMGGGIPPYYLSGDRKNKLLNNLPDLFANDPNISALREGLKNSISTQIANEHQNSIKDEEGSSKSEVIISVGNLNQQAIDELWQEIDTLFDNTLKDILKKVDRFLESASKESFPPITLYNLTRLVYALHEKEKEYLKKIEEEVKTYNNKLDKLNEAIKTAKAGDIEKVSIGDMPLAHFEKLPAYLALCEALANQIETTRSTLLIQALIAHGLNYAESQMLQAAVQSHVSLDVHLSLLQEYHRIQAPSTKSALKFGEGKATAAGILRIANRAPALPNLVYSGLTLFENARRSFQGEKALPLSAAESLQLVGHRTTAAIQSTSQYGTIEMRKE